MGESEPRLSTEGMILVLAGAACLLAAATAAPRGEPDLVVALAVIAGAPAALASIVDLLSRYVPGMGLHLLLGVAASAGALVALSGPHYLTAATLGVAGLMGLGRIYEVEVRSKD